MTPALVLLNGVPASGKSTLARAWCALHGDRLPLALDIDLIRSMLGGWRADPIRGGLAARGLATAVIRAHLAAGGDVVVPQYLRRDLFIDELRDLAVETGAVFVECALVIDHGTALQRFAGRAASVDTTDPVVHGDLEDSMEATVAAFDQFLASRPDAVRLSANGDSAAGQLDALVSAARAE